MRAPILHIAIISMFISGCNFQNEPGPNPEERVRWQGTLYRSNGTVPARNSPIGLSGMSGFISELFPNPGCAWKSTELASGFTDDNGRFDLSYLKTGSPCIVEDSYVGMFSYTPSRGADPSRAIIALPWYEELNRDICTSTNYKIVLIISNANPTDNDSLYLHFPEIKNGNWTITVRDTSQNIWTNIIARKLQGSIDTVSINTSLDRSSILNENDTKFIHYGFSMDDFRKSFVPSDGTQENYHRIGVPANGCPYFDTIYLDFGVATIGS